MEHTQIVLTKGLYSNGTVCSMGEYCSNSPINTSLPRCSVCKLSPSAIVDIGHYWRPTIKGKKHPILEKEKLDLAFKRRSDRVAARKAKDKGRQRVLVKAKKAEELTEKVIQSTVNSGRSNKDGDHVSFGVTLDTKLQSQRAEPIIHWDELDKVRRDAVRAGNSVGALVLQSSTRAAIVIALEDWVTLNRG